MSESSAATLLKKATKKQPLTGADLIHVTAGEIEKLSEDTATMLIHQLIEDGGMNDFRLGGALSMIARNQWFGGYKNFREIVEKSFGLHYRKAQYLVGIYNSLVDAKIPWEKVATLGWTKLKDLAPVLTLDNVDGWVSLAESLTVLQLQDAIKASKGASTVGEEDESDTTTSTVTTVTFKVHLDQKDTIREALNQIKKETNTEFDTVALTYLCAAYLNGAVSAGTVPQITETVYLPAEPVSLVDLMKAKSLEEVAEAFSSAFPDANVVIEV